MKNIKMLVISALLVAVAVTSYAVSGTYAKYTSNVTNSDSARVAKWGIGITNEVNIFTSDYTDVKSADGKDVVAPGTAGSYTFTLTGAPETNYTLSVDITDNSTDAIPQLVYTLDYDEDTNNVTYATLAQLEEAIEAIYSPTKVYAANTNSASTHTIGWYWAFDGDDAADTNLGNAAELANVKLEVSITATQTEAAPTNN